MYEESREGCGVGPELGEDRKSRMVNAFPFEEHEAIIYRVTMDKYTS